MSETTNYILRYESLHGKGVLEVVRTKRYVVNHPISMTSGAYGEQLGWILDGPGGGSMAFDIDEMLKLGWITEDS